VQVLDLEDELGEESYRLPTMYRYLVLTIKLFFITHARVNDLPLITWYCTAYLVKKRLLYLHFQYGQIRY
jgi:hypothetical protein